jgi:hypothetical protein
LLERGGVVAQAGGMRPYLKMFGLVLVVYGVGALFGVFHKAYASGTLDWEVMLTRGAVFVVVAGVGIYMMMQAKKSPPLK